MLDTNTKYILLLIPFAALISFSAHHGKDALKHLAAFFKKNS